MISDGLHSACTRKRLHQTTMLHSPAYFTSLLKASRKGITMCSMDGRVKALVIARECSRVRFLSVLALLVKEALLLGFAGGSTSSKKNRW